MDKKGSMDSGLDVESGEIGDEKMGFLDEDSSTTSTNSGSENSGTNLIQQKKDEAVTQNEVDVKEPGANGEPRRTYWTKVLVTFSVLDVLLLSAIFVVVFGIQHSHDCADDQTEHCLPCSDLYLTQEDMEGNIYKFRMKKDGECCSHNETDIVRKYVVKRYRKDQANDPMQENLHNRTAIHLELESVGEEGSTNGFQLKWKRPSLNSGLSLEGDATSLLVAKEGLYYISSKIVFNLTGKPEVNREYYPISLQVFRRRETGEDIPLLQTKETLCAALEKDCSKPSTCQGVFRLDEGDRISSYITGPCYVISKDNINTLDMYLI